MAPSHSKSTPSKSEGKQPVGVISAGVVKAEKKEYSLAQAFAQPYGVEAPPTTAK